MSHTHPSTPCQCSHTHADDRGVQLPVAADSADRTGTARFHIPGMDCPVEEGDIRRALADIEGIRHLGFELSAQTLSIGANPEVLSLALTAIRKAGFSPTLLVAEQKGEKTTHSSRESWRLGLALLLALGAEGLGFFVPEGVLVQGLGMAMAILAISLAGFSTYTKGFSALGRGQLNINGLMSIAVTGAFLIGQWPEAAMVMALYAIAELIEARSVDRARNAIRALLDLTPEKAWVKQADGNWQEALVKDIAVGTLVQVRPGTRIPLDGVVTLGGSAVNQAPVTGESVPVDKTMGDTLFAGTINETSTLEFRVTASASGTVLARIIDTVEQAQSNRAPTQRFVDRFAAIYTPLVFVIAVGVVLITPWLLDWSWSDSVYKALVLLVIACPCALVIATPVTVVSGLANGARRGILIKGGNHLENAHRLRAIAMDKTGTLTEGKPRLVTHEILGTQEPESRVLDWAASLAGHSSHPVSLAIAQGLDRPSDMPGEFTALAGRGVQARVGHTLLSLGSHRLIEELGLCSREIEARLHIHEAAGRTVTLLASEQEVLALFAVADTLKPSSHEAVQELKKLGVHLTMLTGDNETTARVIAEQAGIEDGRGNLLPEDKLTAIAELQQHQGPTAMVGDGINDAPALAKSDLGIAMGSGGTDIAMETADVVIMNDDLKHIPDLIRLSRRTHRILWQNISLALGIKVVFLALALLGEATMWMAVFADMGASLLVVFNGLRLLDAREGKA